MPWQPPWNEMGTPALARGDLSKVGGHERACACLLAQRCWGSAMCKVPADDKEKEAGRQQVKKQNCWALKPGWGRSLTRARGPDRGWVVKASDDGGPALMVGGLPSWGGKGRRKGVGERMGQEGRGAMAQNDGERHAFLLSQTYLTQEKKEGTGNGSHKYTAGVAHQARDIPAGIPLIDTLHLPTLATAKVCTHAYARQGGGCVWGPGRALRWRVGERSRRDPHPLHTCAPPC